MIPKVRKVKKIIARNWLATPWKKEKKIEKNYNFNYNNNNKQIKKNRE